MTRDQFTVTRRSLVERLVNWNDQQNWRDFFNAYGKMIYRVARKTGLTDAEAQDVVQETVITVAKNIGRLKYDPATGSFKGWLLNIARWRIADAFRKREPAAAPKSRRSDTRRTATLDRLADPAGFDLKAEWDVEWQKNLLTAAAERVKKKVDARQFQIFDCYVMKDWPAQKVARELGVNIAQVYLAKHRISALMKTEIKMLDTRGI